MKKLITIISILFCLSAGAQNVKIDQQGNYVAVTNKKDSATYKQIGKTYSDGKGVVYPVYVSDKGRLFIKKTSKSGNEYKMYLKL